MATKEKAVSGAAGALILAVVALGLGFYAGYVAGGKQQWSVGYSAGSAAARKEFTARVTAALGSIPPAEDVKTVIGRIIEKTGDSVVIETAQLVRDPLAEPAPTRRTVRLAADTKITVMEPVPQSKLAPLEEDFRKKQDAYLKDVEAGKQTAPPVPPNPFEEREAKPGDLAVGQEIAVTAKTGILRAATIDAVSVSASPLAPAPAAPDANAGKAPSPDATGSAAAPTTAAGTPKTSAGSGTAPSPNAPAPAPTPAPGTPTTNSGTGTK